MLRGGCSEGAEEERGVGGRGDKTSREHCEKGQVGCMSKRERKRSTLCNSMEWTCAFWVDDWDVWQRVGGWTDSDGRAAAGRQGTAD